MLLCVAFAIALAVLLMWVFYLQQQRVQEEALSAQARMVASWLAEPQQWEESEENGALRVLNANPQLMLACVFDAKGALKFTQHGVATSIVQCGNIAHTRAPDMLVAHAGVVRKQLPEPIGEVWLAAAMDGPALHLPLAVVISSLLTALLALCYWYLGVRLQRFLTHPMRQIASTAQRVSLYKDYSLRVVPGALDEVPSEIRSLTDSFNAMLKEIEDRDGRLSRKGVELDRARQAAEAASRAKSQFLANVSHELRTPLNAIIGFSRMLYEEQFGSIGNPKYAEYAHDIHDSGKHLLDVINDILDLTKAETGKLSVSFSALNLAKIVEKALRIVAGQAHERKVDIYTDIPEKLPKIIADPVRLVQILLNLLSNALKFTNEGGKVTVRARAEPARQGIHYFSLIVEDTGIGMTDVQIGKVFSSFNQADMGLNRKYDGAGLGLPLTKKLVELHHGKIKIESVLGEGTIVTVRLTSDPALLD